MASLFASVWKSLSSYTPTKHIIDMALFQKAFLFSSLGACCALALTLTGCGGGGGGSDSSADTGNAPQYLIPQEYSSCTVTIDIPSVTELDNNLPALKISFTCGKGSQSTVGAITDGKVERSNQTIISSATGTWQQNGKTTYNQLNDLNFNCSPNFKISYMSIAIQPQSGSNEVPENLKGNAIGGQLEVSLDSQQKIYSLGSNCTVSIAYQKGADDAEEEEEENAD